MPGACESFFEGVHGQKLIRGSKNVAIGRFCIGEYDENRHHIFRTLVLFMVVNNITTGTILVVLVIIVVIVVVNDIVNIAHYVSLL